MKNYEIDDGNAVKVVDSGASGPIDTTFRSEQELGKISASWPISRLVEVWNKLPGVKPVKKFTDRKTALTRIWKAAQALTPSSAPQGAHDAPKAKGSQKKTTREKKTPRARRGSKEAHQGSKTAKVVELMRRPKGATLAEIIKATGWQAHTVRGFISRALVKDRGLKVESFWNDEKERTYRVPT